MPLILVVGTGTEIGKTHLGEALLLRIGASRKVTGYKPVESGVPSGAAGEDAERLRRASTFHVKHGALEHRLARAVGPHLAAREMGITLEVAAITRSIREVAEATDVALVELAGGLFSPLTETESNADVARALHEAIILLVAPDRLGVLHDIGATTRAAAAMGLALEGIILSTPAIPDASTGTNAAEVRCVTSVPALAVLARAPAVDLARTDAVANVARVVLSARR